MEKKQGLTLNPLRWPGYTQTLLAMLLGVAAGIYFKAEVAHIRPVAYWIIEVIKTLAIPLLFFAILDTILKRSLHGRGVFSLLAVATINGWSAIFIALFLSNLFRPGQYLPLSGHFEAAPTLSTLGFKEMLKMGLESPMVRAILSAIILGVVLLPFHKWKGSDLIKSKTEWCLAWVLKIMGWIVHLVPLAVFASVSNVIAKHGLSFLGGIGAYLGFCLLGMLLHVGIVYHLWIIAIAKISFKTFWKYALDPVLHAFGINSSLATLPVTLRALKELGVSDTSARLSACVGTNFNNDGILLYEVVAVLFLSQAYGLDLSFAQQISIAFLCITATIGVSGIPEAGVIALTLALSALKLPVEAIPVLLTVDWIIARTRSSVNVMADMTVAIGIDQLSKSKLIKRTDRILTV